MPATTDQVAFEAQFALRDDFKIQFQGTIEIDGRVEKVFTLERVQD